MSRRPLALLTLAGTSAGTAVAVWLVALGLPDGRALDARAMEAFTGVARPPIAPSISGVAHLADPAPFVLGGLVLIAIALWRRRPLLAAIVPAILLGANVTTQVLKPTLADARLIELHHVQSVYPGSWPSGHATAAMSLALCAVLVAGPRLRPLAALLGAGFAVAVGYALVAAGWHLPSDVLGGYLVAASFALAGAAAVAALEAPRLQAGVAARPPGILSPPALATMAAAALVLAGLTVVARAPEMTISALEHPSAILAGLGIGALALVLTAGMALALRN